MSFSKVSVFCGIKSCFLINSEYSITTLFRYYTGCVVCWTCDWIYLSNALFYEEDEWTCHHDLKKNTSLIASILWFVHDPFVLCVVLWESG